MEYHVAKNGDNSTIGTSGSPLYTIQAAASRAVADPLEAREE